jgi:glycosyltransferase involved in cell wall biosynthesis
MSSNASPGRVLFVHQSSDLYGSDRVLLDIAQAVAQAGGEPVVALPGDGPLPQALRSIGVEVHSLTSAQVLKLSRTSMTAGGALRLLAAVPSALAALDRCVGGRHVDLVHSNTLAVLGGALWARRHGVRHLWHVHEIVERPRLAARAFPWLLRGLADAVVCNSHATRYWLTESQPTLAARSKVVWNGVGATTLSTADSVGSTALQALRRHFRPAGARLAIGLVGRINRMKGHHLLLDAAERLSSLGFNGFSIVFVGSPPPGQEVFLSQLQARIAHSPLRDRVVVQPYMEHVAPAFAALDIVCVPSTEAEAFGLVAVEAMAAGRPVVAARIGGLPEVVLDGETGSLHAPGDAEALATHLQDLLADPQLRHDFGLAGLARFQREFTVGAMSARMLALYGAARWSGR